MAIVQISKIQHRRGREETGTGMPQLASGELGWAIDTQRLYIGNGAVQEGAPYVGNTLILTEKTDIFSLARTYEYKKGADVTIVTGPENAPHINRSLQDRLDDNVSINAFISDDERNSGDLTNAIQRAIDQLFLNDSRSVSTRVILEFEAGEYTISNSIKIPPFANLRGAGKDKTIIIQTGNYPVFETVTGDSSAGSYETENTLFSDLNQPRSINVNGFTLKQNIEGTPVFLLRSTRDSHFANVKFEGAGRVGVEPTAAEVALQMTSADSTMVTCSDNLFEYCEFVNTSYGIESTYDINSNIFAHCLFSGLWVGVLFGQSVNGTTNGKIFGPRNTKFESCKFYNIMRQGISIINGTRNLSTNNEFFSVGNDGGLSTSAVYPVIDFIDVGNVSTDDMFERSIDLTSNPYMIINAPYVGEYGGHVIGDHKYNNSLNIVKADTATLLFRLGAYGNARYRVNYFYRSAVATIIRNGVLYITVDKINSKVHLSDEYDISGNVTKAENLRFTASLEDLNADGQYETVFVKYVNTTTGDQGTLNYWYDVLS